MTDTSEAATTTAPWTSCKIVGDGILCYGNGRHELYDEFVVSANGIEWPVTVIETVDYGRDYDWKAVDTAGFTQHREMPTWRWP